MSTARWELFPHQADMGIRGIGTTRDEAFQQAAMALTATVLDPDTLEPTTPVEISCEAPDDELLLVAWLNELVYAMATRRLLFSRFEVHLDGRQLRAKAWGESIDVLRHQPAVEVKGATLTCVRVEQEPSGDWIAQCVVDV